jgi:phage shock protein PspC (stress-responsive transcriptional regulator)
VTHPTNGQFLAAFVLGVVAGAGVFLHADKNGIRHPTAWACTVFILPITLLAYLIYVRRVRRGRRGR